MSRKRHNTSSAEDDSPPAKRHNTSSYQGSSEDEDSAEQPQIDAIFGQAGAFPGLANDAGNALFYGPARDGIDYLRMVRSEATTIPYLLSTATLIQPLTSADIDNECYDGFFDEDEAFVAKPLVKQELESVYNKPQQYYYDAILLKFYALRSRLRIAPALHNIQALPDSIPISFPGSSKVARSAWLEYILHHPPHPVQLGVMDADSVLELLRLITKRMTRLLRSSNKDSMRRLGAWIWTLLARCPERGELGSEEVADLRACVKAAEDAMNWGYGRTSETNSMEGSDEEEESTTDKGVSVNKPTVAAENDVGEDGQAQKSLEIHSLHEEAYPVELSTQRMVRMETILDMMITVVGEVYGQQDLLMLRRTWK